MKEIPFNKDPNPLVTSTSVTTTVKFIKPLQIRWTPKEDITTHELALCLPYLLANRSIMPYEVDLSKTYFRHFEIIDPNI